MRTAIRDRRRKSEVNADVETRKPTLGLAIIGCGRVVEQCHLPALRNIGGLRLMALCDPDAARLERLANRLGVRRRYSGYRATLDDGGVDVVAVCTPPDTHAEIGLAALEAGKHLMVEKPLALNLTTPTGWWKGRPRARQSGGWFQLALAPPDSRCARHNRCRRLGIAGHHAHGVHLPDRVPGAGLAVEAPARLGRRRAVRSRYPPFRSVAVSAQVRSGGGVCRNAAPMSRPRSSRSRSAP